MKNYLIQSVLLVFLFFSCTTETHTEIKLAPPQQNKYASFFNICKQDSFSVLITYLNTAKTDSAIYVLYKGTKPQLNLRANYIKTPCQKVACLSTTFVGFIARLEAVEKIKAVDNIDFISNAMVRYLNAEGSVKQLSKSGQLNIEETLMSGVQVIFTNPSGDKKKDFDKRLIEAEIIPVVCADYFENHPLGRAEWIKAIAPFFGEEHKADSLFAETEKKYIALKSSADTCVHKPTVFTELKTSDTWFVSGGKSSLAQFLNDAGANYLWKENGKTEVTALNMEQVIQKALNADYWINLHVCNSANELLKMDKRYGEFKAFKTGNLYNNNGMLNEKGGNDYWETGLCNPDQILSELIKIFHPNLQADTKLKYYKQLK